MNTTTSIQEHQEELPIHDALKWHKWMRVSAVLITIFYVLLIGAALLPFVGVFVTMSYGFFPSEDELFALFLYFVAATAIAVLLFIAIRNLWRSTRALYQFTATESLEHWEKSIIHLSGFWRFLGLVLVVGAGICVLFLLFAIVFLT